jgi:glycosyltransferase involved in cell wall biosynthesis
MIDRLGVAGIECQLLLLLAHLDRSRIEPTLCLLDGSDESLRALEPDNLPVVHLGVHSLLRPSTLLKAARFAHYLRRQRIDVLQPLLPDSLYFSALAGKMAGVRVVRFRVDLNYWMGRIDRWALRALRPCIDATIANCEACKQVVIAQERGDAASIAVIPNGIDLERFVSVRALDALPKDRPQRVGIVANLRPVKNLEMLIQTAANLRAGHPRLHVAIAGEGPSRARLESLCRELDLQGQVELPGTVTDVPAFLESLDVAVLCSHSEGAPNAIMEYMAAGRPIVATDVGGNRELLCDGAYGLLVPPGDVAALTAAIDRLLRDRPLACRLGASARQRAMTEYGVAMQVGRYEVFYRTLVDDRRDGRRTPSESYAELA